MSFRPCLGLLLVVCAVTGGCLFSPSRGFCEAAGECDEDAASVFFLGRDRVGASDDSVEVCVAEQDGFLRQLRANEEKICHEQADAWERYMACVAKEYSEGDACDGLRNPAFNNNPCDDELDDFEDARRDAGNDCSKDEE